MIKKLRGWSILGGYGTGDDEPGDDVLPRGKYYILVPKGLVYIMRVSGMGKWVFCAVYSGLQQ